MRSVVVLAAACFLSVAGVLRRPVTARSSSWSSRIFGFLEVPGPCVRMAGRRRGSGVRGFWSLGFFAAASPLPPAVVQSPGGGVKELEAWECAGTVLSFVDDLGGLAEDGRSRHLRLRREAMMVAWRRLSADTRSAARFRRLRRMDYAAFQHGWLSFFLGCVVCVVVPGSPCVECSVLEFVRVCSSSL